MQLPKVFVALALFLFTTIAALALIKQYRLQPQEIPSAVCVSPLEVELDTKLATLVPQAMPASSDPQPTQQPLPLAWSGDDDVDRLSDLFYPTSQPLPIVETLTYTPRVKWLKGRAAWLVDYARHHRTSKHFIARSLCGRADYTYHKVSQGDRFNVLRQDKSFEFYLLVDTSKCKLWLYYLDLDLKSSTLLKTYRVCLGRLDSQRSSGFLTPHGKYLLGERIASYGPKDKGLYHGKQIEMMRVFGTRWIPFAKEIGLCTEPAKGFGIHGMPWKEEGANRRLIEDLSSLGQYQSDGCIRLPQADVEELYAIIVTRPATIEIVKDATRHPLPYAESSIVALQK